MTKDETAGFSMGLETAEKYFTRCLEAEKKMGPLSRDERITILKSLASPITFEELMDMMTGKRVLIVGGKDGK